MRIYLLNINVLADASNCNDCLPHEVLRWFIVDLTKLPTRLLFCTSTFSKSTYFILPQDSQRRLRANLRDLTHLFTIQGGLVYRRLFQSIVNFPHCSVYISCKSNQSLLNLFKNPPRQKLVAISPISSRNFRLPLLRPIGINSHLTKQICLKPPRLTLRFPPLTDLTKIKTVLAIVRKK